MSQDSLDLKERQAPLVPKAHKALLALLERLVHKVRLELMELLVQLALQVLRELLVQME